MPPLNTPPPALLHVTGDGYTGPSSPAAPQAGAHPQRWWMSWRGSHLESHASSRDDVGAWVQRCGMAARVREHWKYQRDGRIGACFASDTPPLRDAGAAAGVQPRYLPTVSSSPYARHVIRYHPVRILQFQSFIRHSGVFGFFLRQGLISSEDLSRSIGWIYAYPLPQRLECT